MGGKTVSYLQGVHLRPRSNVQLRVRWTKLSDLSSWQVRFITQPFVEFVRLNLDLNSNWVRQSIFIHLDRLKLQLVSKFDVWPGPNKLNSRLPIKTPSSGRVEGLTTGIHWTLHYNTSTLHHSYWHKLLSPTRRIHECLSNIFVNTRGFCYFTLKIAY